MSAVGRGHAVGDRSRPRRLLKVGARLARRVATVSVLARRGVAVSVAIVVPGNGISGRDGVYRISPRCIQLVREVSRLAAELPAGDRRLHRALAAGGPSEAEQMRDVRRRPDKPSSLAS